LLCGHSSYNTVNHIALIAEMIRLWIIVQ